MIPISKNNITVKDSPFTAVEIICDEGPRAERIALFTGIYAKRNASLFTTAYERHHERPQKDLDVD